MSVRACVYNYYRDYDPQTGRYIESDPIGLGGGVNTYAYGYSAPVRNADRLGLWSTAAHNEIIEALALQWNLTPQQVVKMQLGSASVDHGITNQNAAHAYLHAMSSRKLTQRQACEKMNSYVADELQRFGDLQASGSDDAYFELGKALHPIMDSTSPVHAGFQEWHL